MNTKQLLTLFFCTIFLACSEENSVTPTEITTTNLSISIDENPAAGAVLGSIAATASQGTLSYALSSESVSGAFSVNASTGVVSVLGASHFDFEKNPTITGVVTTSANGVSKTATITITLKNLIDVSGLIAHFPFNGNATDVVGSLSGVLDEGVALGTDKSGAANSAYSFTSNSYIRIDDNNSLSLDTKDGISISAWIKQTAFPSSGHVQIISKWSFNAASEQYGLFVKSNNNLVAVGRSLSGGVTDAANYSINTWYHVVFTFDKASKKVTTYVNGAKVLDSAGAEYTNSNGTKVSLLIGGLQGSIDNVRIYNKALTANEVTELKGE